MRMRHKRKLRKLHRTWLRERGEGGGELFNADRDYFLVLGRERYRTRQQRAAWRLYLRITRRWRQVEQGRWCQTLEAIQLALADDDDEFRWRARGAWKRFAHRWFPRRWRVHLQPPRCP